MAEIKELSLKAITDSIKNSVPDVLQSSDFISRTIGMNNSYEDIMFIVQALGREPVSLLGKNYAFIYDHVRRNYMQGKDVPSLAFKDLCNKFTFYKEVPTVRFADPINDPMNLLNKWKPNMEFEANRVNSRGKGASRHYAESSDNTVENRYVSSQLVEVDGKKLDGYDLENGNPGAYTSSIESYGAVLPTCDMIGKTNANFNHGKYQTLVARFHTNALESRDKDNSTQTAYSDVYGQSHGRNLFKTQDGKSIYKTIENGYDNPYCRVWTYHHQYNQIKRQIRPFDNANTQVKLEDLEGGQVSFRTRESHNYKVDGGSKRLDDNGVLNYNNGTVNIAPTAKIKDYFEGKQNDYANNIISTKKCMFSIENLAWRDDKANNKEYDPYGLSPEQRGPLGGRIMWFPPYNLKFNEDVRANWNNNQFIGRGEGVYTYTNTERSGNLSFTLLIDHPSLIDYWSRKDKDGTQLDKGNDGGVDNVHNEENTLLRFFAGCEVLTTKPQYYKYTKIVNEEPPKPIEPTPPPPEVIKKKIPGKICAVLYYPNNYSGVDDKDGVVNPIEYLMNGVGTQKQVEGSGSDAKLTDIPTCVNYPLVGTLNNGGYEVYTGIVGGISQTENPLDEDTEVCKKTFADPSNDKNSPQYLTHAFGTKIYASYGDNSYTLAKMIGSLALPLSQAKGKNLTANPHQWFRRRYYYRCDKEYLNQQFSRQTSYIDAKSFGLNGNGFGDVRRYAANAFKIENDNDNYRLVSFAELFVALKNDDANNILTGVTTSSSSKDNIEEIRKIFSNKDKIYSDIEVSFDGHASYQGRKASNDKLAKNRALTAKKWMMGLPMLNGVKMSEPQIVNQDPNGKKTIDVGGQDEEEVKIWRSVSITISYKKEVVVEQADSEQSKASDKIGQDNKTVETLVKTSEKSDKGKAYQWLRYSAEGQSVLRAYPQLYQLSPTITFKDISKVTGKDYSDADVSNNFEKGSKDNAFISRDMEVKRYDNEGEFFQALVSNEPFLHHLISDKIKYFDPAFHSISPEGFNARLTFLHQCTRQGATVGNADSVNSSVATTAYNLAFGRPPVCVLRLGDFFNTKIIIESLSINYDQPQWDMNPEGIGMMPMFADVNINFKFIGGSDLAGPISRLQNAVSFNYYANTSVYDNRAEVVEYNSNGNGKEIKFKGYTYPNMYAGDRKNIGRIGEVDDQGYIYGEEF